MINDFRDTIAFIDYKRYGTLEVSDASLVSGGKPNHGGRIEVFINFKSVGKYTTKQQAHAEVSSLIRNAPAEAREWFAANQSVLLDTLK